MITGTFLHRLTSRNQKYYLVDEVNKLGLKFGIWFEPEMISPDSDLYRAHPDWCIHIEGRVGSLSRNQYVLDLSRKEVREYVYESITKILTRANIEYVKWDMNRPLSDVGNSILPPSRQREIWHRYVLGVLIKDLWGDFKAKLMHYEKE